MPSNWGTLPGETMIFNVMALVLKCSVMTLRTVPVRNTLYNVIQTQRQAVDICAHVRLGLHKMEDSVIDGLSAAVLVDLGF